MMIYSCVSICLLAGCVAALVSVCVDVVLPCSLSSVVVGCVTAGTWCYLSFSLAVLLPCINHNQSNTNPY